ncbi:DEAD/DEAH box helicase domain protein [Pyrolobus fumarii 1A]|uniref:DEAD/DEAH box helicase domain protein n=1 Tax=Pyrolobus fumarii (strain DSM 11204 / 1A) TaxID=694429 RepID=G0EDZ1_PYRF1|nr:DEAD/DEAH box helicase [Pyrolobus fumarii]AEM37907.1 DEAD/DEAH box helicase domain protein [Pyrolobus fumarii 1A]
MRVVSVAGKLIDLGYQVVVWDEAGSEPEVSSKTFADIVPRLAGSEVGSWRLYRHQVESIEALRRGENIVLTARTGSGKTESWALAALAEGWRVLAIYPTLALAADQIHRLEKYYTLAGYGPHAVMRLDRPTLDKLGGPHGVIRALSAAKVVVSNPAFLMAELKRIAVGRGLLEHFLTRVDLIVLDELDFYGPRGAHLLIAMLELISRYIAVEPPRVAVLTATLGNPGELAKLLERITGRKSRVITGSPRRPPNRYVLVLGKGVDALRRFVKQNASVIASRVPWVLELLDDEEEFAERAYEVYEALEAIGLRPPRPSLDPVEILSAILDLEEDGVTLAFTRSIRHAERVYRSLLDRNPRAKSLAAVHHHLVPKDRREEVERAAREGRLKLVVTVRTLAQGIDIGTIVRVVHVGLPSDTREFHQREGRKGRRKEIPFTESVLIPQGLWDSKLLRAGAEAVREWTRLHLEKLYINPRNAYAALFRGLWKTFRGLKLDPDEEEVLRKFGLVTVKHTLAGERIWPSEKGMKVWNNLGFYEYGPPYGYKRYIRRNGREERVPEEASIREAVERLQPGCYDYTTNAIVVEHDAGKLRIVEEPIERAVERYEWLRKAVGEYEDVKLMWRERPDIAGDLLYGRVSTSVVLRVEAPVAGFGPLVELPAGVEWVVESRRPRITRSGRVYHEIHSIQLDVATSGKYSDFTYGYVVEVPSDTDPLEIEAGLAYLQVFLRLSDYSLPLGLLRYTVMPAGIVKRIHIWEEEPAGIIEGLDWARIAREVESFKPTPLALTLLAAIDPAVYNSVVQNEKLIDALPLYAARMAKLIAGVRSVEIAGVRVECPRPSPEHRIATLLILHEKVDTGRTVLVDVIGVHDGSGPKIDVYTYEPGVTSGYEVSVKLYGLLGKLFKEGYKVYHYGQERLLVNLLAGAYMAYMIVDHAKREGKLVDLAEELRKRVGDVPLVALGDVGRRLARQTSRFGEELQEAMKRAREERNPEPVVKVLRSIARETLETLYCLALALEKGIVERVENSEASRNDSKVGNVARRRARHAR